MRKLELAGKKFNRLTYLSEWNDNNRQIRRALWLCDCGKKTVTRTSYVVSGQTKSCGCFAIEVRINKATTHKLTNHPIHRIWNDMKNRCHNANRKAFKNYGGRGITICNEWNDDFKKFYDWCIANGWEKGLQIDRIENDGNYESSNCRFVTAKLNGRNKRNNVIIEFMGLRKTAVEWSEITGIETSNIYNRKHLGWSDERIIITPVT